MRYVDEEPRPLDPTDWDDYRQLLHEVVDACVDHLSRVSDKPWQPVDAAFHESIAVGDAREGYGLRSTAKEMVEHVLPHHAGNTHPRFFGWVQGSGTTAGLVAEIVAATMNSNCGGRDHGAVYVEREVIRWCAGAFGFPLDSSGVLVTGTSQAMVLALAVARTKTLGASTRSRGLRCAEEAVLFAAEGVHSSIVKAAELLGFGANAVRRVPADPSSGAMSVAALEVLIEEARAKGEHPICVVATAGSVDRGAFDPLQRIADVCEREDLWLHVDGAFGAWVRIANAPWCDLVDGIERADSLAVDFHKWMFVQYDCGLVLVRDADLHRATFSERPAYLAPQGVGLAGGDPWYCDFGTDLSRSFRALKVWATLRAYGSRHLGRIVSWNCQLASLMAYLVEASHEFELLAPVTSNVCCFGVTGVNDDADARVINEAIVHRLQRTGDAVFSTTRIGARSAIRAAITNHRTRRSDVEFAIASAVSASVDLRSGLHAAQ